MNLWISGNRFYRERIPLDLLEKIVFFGLSKLFQLFEHFQLRQLFGLFILFWFEIKNLIIWWAWLFSEACGGMPYFVFFFSRFFPLLRLLIICTGMGRICCLYTVFMYSPYVFMDMFNMVPGYLIFIVYVCCDDHVISSLKKRIPKTVRTLYKLICCRDQITEDRTITS